MIDKIQGGVYTIDVERHRRLAVALLLVRSKDRRLWECERSLLLFYSLNNQACKADENQTELKQFCQSYVHGQPPFPESRKKCAGIAAPALYSPNGDCQ